MLFSHPCHCLLFQIPIVDDELKKAAGEVKDDGKYFVSRKRNLILCDVVLVF